MTMSFSLESHPSEGAILAYLGERPSDVGPPPIDEHLDACGECRELVVAMARTVPGESGDVHESGERSVRVMMPVPGDLLAGRFHLMEVLGSGAMGVVFKAVDTLLGVSVAIKVFPPSMRFERAALDSIHREASLGRRLNHPHIRRVYTLETVGEITFLVMELIEGETLEDRLRRGAPASREALRILDELCDAVCAAHAAGIVHRDLKPDNIAIDRSGRVVVMDFGLARDVDLVKSRHTKGLIGTPAYWSPEQSRGEPATAASDIFSLGLIAHYLLTGRPFSLSAPVPLPRRYRSAVNRCLEQRPEDRFGSVRALRKAIASGNGHRRLVSSLVTGGLAVAVVLGLPLPGAHLVRAASPVSAPSAVALPMAASPIAPVPLATATAVAAPVVATQDPASAVPVHVVTSPPRPRAVVGRPSRSPRGVSPNPPTVSAASGAPAKAEKTEKDASPLRAIDRESPYAASRPAE
jgi:eukaryotic-like serine/threonine-protein kinase